MWAMISKLLLRLAALRWILKLGGLGVLLPIAFLLKAVGLPILAVLSVLALPLLLLLFVIGLPVFLVIIVGTMLMGLLGMVLSIGVAAVKIGIFVVLPIWLLFTVGRWIFKRGGNGGCGDTGTKPSTDTPPADTTMDPSTDSRSGPTGDPLSGPISDL
jgi:hypothetical protein